MNSETHVGGVPLVGGAEAAPSPEDTVDILSRAKDNADANPQDEANPQEKNPLLRQRTYQFAADEINALVKQRLMQVARTAKIKGFREGKVPLNVIQSRVGDSYLLEVLGEKTEAQFNQDAMTFADSEKPAAAPRMARAPQAPAGQYQVECSYEVMPEVAAPNFDKQQLRRPQLEVGDDEISTMMERLRENKKHYHPAPASQVAQKTDVVKVDCIVRRKDNDEVVEDVKDRSWQLDSPMLAAEVVQELIGACAGEQKQIIHTVPNTHPDESMRGASLQMDVTIKEVMVPHLPEMNDAFFAEFGVKEGGIEAFRKMVGEHLKTEVKNRIASATRMRVMNILQQATPDFPLPQTLLMQEASSILRRTEQDLEARGLPKTLAKVTEETAPQLYAQAAGQVRLGLIINAWREREKVTISNDEIQTRLNEIAQDYESPDEFKRQVQGNERSMYSLHLSLLEDKVADWVADKVQVVDVPVTLTQLLDGGMDDENSSGQDSQGQNS